MTEEQQFHLEVLKLLLQVGWADHDLQAAEVALILDLAQRFNLPKEEILALDTCMCGDAPLPPPDLGLLKSRREDVLDAVGELLVSDLDIATEEREMLAQIESLIS